MHEIATEVSAYNGATEPMEPEQKPDSLSATIERYLHEALDLSLRYVATTWLAIIHPNRLIGLVVEEKTNRLCEPALFLAISWIISRAIGNTTPDALNLTALSSKGIAPPEFIFNTLMVFCSVAGLAWCLGAVLGFDARNRLKVMAVWCYFFSACLFLSLLLGEISDLWRSNEEGAVHATLWKAYTALAGISCAVAVVLIYPGVQLFRATRKMVVNSIPKPARARVCASVVIALLSAPVCFLGGGIIPLLGDVGSDRDVFKFIGPIQVMPLSAGEVKDGFDGTERWRVQILIRNFEEKPLTFYRDSCHSRKNGFQSNLKITNWSAHDDPVLIVKPNEVGWAEFEVTDQLGESARRSGVAWLEMTCTLDGKQVSEFVKLN
jgi:hypothetical protein